MTHEELPAPRVAVEPGQVGLIHHHQQAEGEDLNAMGMTTEYLVTTLLLQLRMVLVWWASTGQDRSLPTR